MTYTIVSTTIRHGYTGYDHLIDSSDIDAVTSLIGRSYRTYAAAQRAVEAAYVASCDRRVMTARIDVTCIGPRGYVGPESGAFTDRDQKEDQARKLAKIWMAYGDSDREALLRAREAMGLA